MIVVATQLGYIYNRRVREGDKIKLKDPKHFSSKWMEKLEGKKEVESEEVSTKRGPKKKKASEVFGSLVQADDESEEDEVI